MKERMVGMEGRRVISNEWVEINSTVKACI